MSEYCKVFLIGMPGSGKSYQGKLLAEKLNLPFIDLDEQIIKTVHQSIGDYFQKEGEKAFRNVEREVLLETIKNNSEFVMATGGGTPCFFDNLDRMGQSGITVFLDTPHEVLMERIKLSKSRPLMQGDPEKKLKEMFETRLEKYRKAQLTTADPEPEVLARLVNDLIKS